MRRPAPNAETCTAKYVETYRELRAAGYGGGEVPLPRSSGGTRRGRGGVKAEIEIVVLLSAYARGGIERFHQESTAEYFRQLEELGDAGARVACAPHSVRACPPDWLEEIGAYAERERLPLHVHADEQPREIEECLESTASGRSSSWPAPAASGRGRPSSTRPADDNELDLLAQAGSRVCICPTTEANLGDGFAPVERLRERRIGICIGSDSNVRIDPLEELRARDDGAAAQPHPRAVRRGHAPLLRRGRGRGLLGLDSWPDTSVDLDHRSLRGVEPADVLDALVFGCAADVFV